jgi:hypothetical protein
MSRSQIIISSIALNNDLARKSMTVKQNGENCAYKLLNVGFTDGENYEAELAAAKPLSDIFPIPMVTSDPNFKENLALAKFRNQVTIEDAKVDTIMYDTLAAALGEASMMMFMKSTWAKHHNQHTFVELYAYYRLDVLRICPSDIEEIMSSIRYDSNLSFDENMAILVAIIEAVQPHEAVSDYQQLKMLKDMTKGEPAVQKAHANYQQQNPKFEKQSVKAAIKSISRELRNNPTIHVDQVSSINNMRHDELMEVNGQLLQVQAMQEARINQLMAAVNMMPIAPTPSAPRVTTKYCHLHGSNNTHDGTECKKMGSPGFMIKGKAVTQAMIGNRVPGAVVEGVKGKM